MHPKKDITGIKFDRLTAIKFNERKITPKSCNSYWLFKCDCGNEKIICKSSVTSKRIRSCGCLLKETAKKLNEGNTRSRKNKGIGGLHQLYHRYKMNAKQRNHIFNLNIKDFELITSSNCTYCNKIPSLSITSAINGMAKGGLENSLYIYNGIDRIDSKKGYELNNVTACCITCNRAKNSMKLDEFKEWIKKVYLNLFSEKEQE